MKLEVKYFNSITPFAKQWIDKSRRVVYNLGELNWEKNTFTFDGKTYVCFLLRSVTTNYGMPGVSSNDDYAKINVTGYNIRPRTKILPGDKNISINTSNNLTLYDTVASSMTLSEFKAYVNGIYISWVSEPIDEFKWLSQNQYYLNHNYGIVDLGTLTWTKGTATYSYFSTSIPGIKTIASTSDTIDMQLSIPGIKVVSQNVWTTNRPCIFKSSASTYIGMSGEDYDNMDATAFKSAMSGKYLIYERATPRKYGTVNLGDLSYVYSSGRDYFYSATIPDVLKKPSANNVKADIICTGWTVNTNTAIYGNTGEGIGVSTSGTIVFRRTGLDMTATQFKDYVSGQQLIFLINDEDYDTIDFSEWTGTITKQTASKRVRFPLSDAIEPNSNVYNYKYKFNQGSPNGTEVSNTGNVSIYDEYFAVERTDDEIKKRLKGHIFTYKKKVEEP